VSTTRPEDQTERRARTGPVNRLLRLPLWQPLGSRDFRLVWAGESISVTGDQFYAVALPWLTLQVSGSALTLSTVLMIGIIPRTLLTLFGGAIVDRSSPRLLMLGSNAVRALLVGIFAVLVLSGRAQLWHLYVLSLLVGVVASVFYPAFDTITPTLLPEEELAAGNALLQGSAQLASLIGPVLAGAIIATIGTATGNGLAFAVDALSFTAAAIALGLMRGGNRTHAQTETDSEDPAAKSSSSLLSEIGGGIQYVWHHPALRGMVLVTLGASFAVAGPAEIGLATLAHNRFHSAAAFGLMLTAFGLGALLGTIAAGALGEMRRRGATLIALCAMFSLGLMLIGVAQNVVVAGIILALLGAGNGLIGVSIMTWLQAGTAPHMRGRVMSLFAFGNFGLTPLSLLFSGIIAQANVTLLFTLGAALMAVVTVCVLLSRPMRAFD
jgi:MFS family permease